jgi:hypothetical protein
MDQPISPITKSFTTSTMKRKTDQRGSLDGNALPDSKKRALSSEEAASRFRNGLFDPAEQKKYTDAYTTSSPYVCMHP